MIVAALYIDPRGPYPSIEGVDAWDETRDARRYLGTDPVVAHPPCGPWGALRHLVVPGRGRVDESDCGPIAVGQVRRFGGVLEHPAGSKLWDFCGLPKPGEPADKWGGYAVEVRQVDWGHPARKKTWLYCVRVPRVALVTPAPREPTHWISGGRNPLRKNGRRGGGIVPPGIKVCSAQQRRRTPPDFARYLVSLARAAGRRPYSLARSA